jgi:DNA-binding CsgD family transcriptional regulator
MDNKEISTFINITVESVKKAKNRLKKKLSLEPEDSLSEFLKGL